MDQSKSFATQFRVFCLLLSFDTHTHTAEEKCSDYCHLSNGYLDIPLPTAKCAAKRANPQKLQYSITMQKRWRRTQKHVSWRPRSVSNQWQICNTRLFCIGIRRRHQSSRTKRANLETMMFRATYTCVETMLYQSNKDTTWCAFNCWNCLMKRYRETWSISFANTFFDNHVNPCWLALNSKKCHAIPKICNAVPTRLNSLTKTTHLPECFSPTAANGYVNGSSLVGSTFLRIGSSLKNVDGYIGMV